MSEFPVGSVRECEAAGCNKTWVVAARTLTKRFCTPYCRGKPNLCTDCGRPVVKTAARCPACDGVRRSNIAYERAKSRGAEE